MPLPPLVEPVETLPETERGRTDRQRRLPEIGDLGQRRLAAARVLVIGAGGLGAPALTYLAAAGVGTIGIVDDDVVELSNLHRQPVHGVSDVGRPKVESAAEAVLALAPDAHVERHNVRLDRTNAQGLLAGYDLVVDGTDTFETRYLVDDVCADLGLPLVWATVLRFDAQLSVFWAAPPVGDGVRLRTLFPSAPAPGEVPSCAEAGVLGALCGQVGAMMAQEAVKLITGIGEPLLGRVLVIDALRARQREIPLLAAPAPVEPSGAAAVDAPNGADASAAAVRIERVDAAGLRERLQRRASGTDRFVLLDVREPDEHAERAIPGSVLVPLGEVLRDPDAVRDRLRREGRPGGAVVDGGDAIDADADADAGGASGRTTIDTPIIVHCRTDQRAQRAALALARAGAQTTVLDGGILAWADLDAAPATAATPAEASTAGAPPPMHATTPTQETPAPARRAADHAPARRPDLPAQATPQERTPAEASTGADGAPAWRSELPAQGTPQERPAGEAATTGAAAPSPAGALAQETPAPARRVADGAPACRSELPAQGTPQERPAGAAATTGAAARSPAGALAQEKPVPARRVADDAPAWRTGLPAQGMPGARAADGAAGRA